MKKCIICGKELKNRQIKYCSHSCGSKGFYRKISTKVGTTRKCIKCEKEFVIKSSSHKYCNDCKPDASQYFYKLRFDIFKRDNFTCQYCGANVQNTPGTILELEHINPKSKGGKLKTDNLTTSCKLCNRGKKATIINSAMIKRLSNNPNKSGLI